MAIDTGVEQARKRLYLLGPTGVAKTIGELGLNKAKKDLGIDQIAQTLSRQNVDPVAPWRHGLAGIFIDRSYRDSKPRIQTNEALHKLTLHPTPRQNPVNDKYLRRADRALDRIDNLTKAGLDLTRLEIQTLEESHPLFGLWEEMTTQYLLTAPRYGGATAMTHLMGGMGQFKLMFSRLLYRITANDQKSENLTVEEFLKQLRVGVRNVVSPLTRIADVTSKQIDPGIFTYFASERDGGIVMIPDARYTSLNHEGVVMTPEGPDLSQEIKDTLKQTRTKQTPLTKPLTCAARLSSVATRPFHGMHLPYAHVLEGLADQTLGVLERV